MDQYIFGIRPVAEAIEAGKVPDRVFLQQGLQGENFQRLFHLIRNKNIPFQMVPVEKLNRITRKNHQGVVASVSLIEYQPLDEVLQMVFDSGETPLLVILDNITDVRNLGAVARSASCAGAHALVIPAKGTAPVNADAIKASAGALSRITVCREANIMESITFLKACGLHILAFDEKGRNNIYEADLTKPVCIILGSEEKGIAPSIQKMADQTVAIPMKGNIASLNVSVAAGIAFFETLRQREHANQKAPD